MRESFDSVSRTALWIREWNCASVTRVSIFRHRFTNNHVHTPPVNLVNVKPFSDWDLNSHYSITAESNTKVVRIRETDHQLKKIVIVKQFLQVSTIGNE